MSYSTVAASLVAASGGILFGYDMGIISGALLQLREEFKLSYLMQEVIVSSLLFGAIISSLFGGTVIDVVGRKFTMIGNCLVFAIGALILSFTPSVTVLVFGRVFLGLAVGLSVVAECAYITEISNPEHRGKLVSLTEVAIALGFLMAYFINYLFILIPHGWRFMFGISAIFALGQGFALLFVPKSPRFLIIKNKPIEALQVLRRLRSDEDSAHQELSSLKHHLSSEQNLGWKELCSQKNNLCYRLVIGLGLAFLQQASGLPTILYYAPVVLKQIGFYSNQSATLATIGAGVTKMVAVCISLCAVDRIGRKKLLTIGTVLMALCLFFASALNRPSSIPCQEDNCDSHGENINFTDNEYVSNATTEQVSASLPVSTCLSLVCMLCYVAAYSISYGPVTWLLLSEIFPSSVKGRSIALVVAANWTFNLVFSFTFLDYLAKTGIMWTFITYGIACSIGLLFVLTVVPETKGRTLEDIDSSLNELSVLRELKLRCASSVCTDSGSPRASYEPLSQGPEPALRTSSADSHTESAL